MNARASHSWGCSCYLCKIRWDGLVYSCSICTIQLTLEDINAPRTITDAASHEHPWTHLKRRIPFKCDFCGDDGDHSTYICITCYLIIHKKCISLPRIIRIARHPHPISHAHAYAYSLQQIQHEELDCRICCQEVNVRYGIYCCSVLNCNYIARMNCATDEDVWDGTVVLEGDEMSEEVVDSRSLVTDISEETVGEEVFAMEIKHSFHDHNLILITVEGQGQNEMEDHHDNICDACVRPIWITTPFYYYKCQHHQQCSFVLHKSCAELPRQIGHTMHKHLLKLADRDDQGINQCSACDRVHNGFRYECDRRECHGYQIDVRCSLLPDTLSHPNHQHSLFLYHKNIPSCPVYICTDKLCRFGLDLKFVTLPLTTRYKYDKHPLTLTDYDNFDRSQFCCDLCEEETDSNWWFYYCEHCDNSVHQECVIGELPFVKPGHIDDIWRHEHPLTFVDNIWDCPPCVVCKKLCHRQALQCKQSGCNFTVHRRCRYYLEDVLEERNSGSGK